jgi:hypothetical protein
MSEAAPQAAGGMTAAEIAQALDVLWALREDEYLIGCDDRGWWASRRSVTGHIMLADGPVELGQLIGADSVERSRPGTVPCLSGGGGRHDPQLCPRRSRPGTWPPRWTARGPRRAVPPRYAAPW